MAVLSKLTVQNKHQRMAFAEWGHNNEASFNNVWFSDEAHFHLDGVVKLELTNSTTCRTLSPEMTHF
jgi:phage terminase large subunit-like protein